jgi:hypothetical protein
MFAASLGNTVHLAIRQVAGALQQLANPKGSVAEPPSAACRG